jgi:hypothetical protein
MKRRILGLLAGPILLNLLVSVAVAQNVSGYGSMENPYLLLLREPAVQEDLALNARQHGELRRVNDQVDGPLLALRNWPAEKANAKVAELIEQTRSALEEVLDEAQRQRLGQIMLRVRGIQSVLTEKVAVRLNLTAAQRESIEAILAETREEIESLSKELQSGAPAAQVQRQATLAQELEQRRVLAELTDGQKRLFAQLLGRSFDPSRLGKARFRAPEVEGSGPWLNSEPLQPAQLHGQVIALHFFAFG